MTAEHAPALNLPDLTTVAWRSLTKIIREPEQNWPREILERPIITGQVNRKTVALIADPEAAKTVLTGREAQFPKWRIYQRVFAAGLGQYGLGTVEGEAWARQHRLLAPQFSPARSLDFCAVVRSAVERCCQEWRHQGDEIPIEVSAEMTLITLHSMWMYMFGRAERDDMPLIAQLARQIDNAQLDGDPNVPPALYTELALAAQKRMQTSGLTTGPFAGTTVPDSVEDGLSPIEWFDNIRLFLAAGSETSAGTLTWALWLLSQSPHVALRAQEEIDQVVGTDAMGPEHVSRLVFLSHVLKETLRLYPASVVVVRQTTGDEVLAGERLPSRSVLAVCLYAMHRHRLWWHEPDAFRPERFDDGSVEPRHPFAFIPFSGGRHICIGRHAGWIEMITILATILQRFRISAASDVRPEPRVSITIRPAGPIPLILRPR